MHKSIFRRLFFTHLIVLTVLLFVLSLIMNGAVTKQTEKNLTDEFVESTKLIEHWTAIYQIENYSSRTTQSYQERIWECADIMDCDIIVTSLDGEVLCSTNPDIEQIPARKLNPIRKNKIFSKPGSFKNVYSGGAYTVGVPLKYRGTTVGGVLYNSSMPDINSVVSKIMILFVTALFIAALCAILSVYLQAKNLSKRLRAIKSVALDIAAGHFSKRLPVKSNDEIGQLCSAFNFMSDSLEKLDNMRNRFLSDVSHELRTPMTSMSGFIQGILDGPIPPEKQSEYLQIVYDETVRLTRLVNDMFEMTKLSSSEYKLNISEFDGNELVRLCIISLEQKIDDKGVELDVNFERDNMKVCADRDAIQRVLINLIDNAIKFSHVDTTIKIKTMVRNKKAYFTVGNYGVPISQEDLAHVFDRFYKTDISRNGSKSGAGLGLSFVKNIMNLHKQTITVTSIPVEEKENQNYTEFNFTLELA